MAPPLCNPPRQIGGAPAELPASTDQATGRRSALWCDASDNSVSGPEGSTSDSIDVQRCGLPGCLDHRARHCELIWRITGTWSTVNTARWLLCCGILPRKLHSYLLEIDSSQFAVPCYEDSTHASAACLTHCSSMVGTSCEQGERHEQRTPRTIWGILWGQCGDRKRQAPSTTIFE